MLGRRVGSSFFDFVDFLSLVVDVELLLGSRLGFWLLERTFFLPFRRLVRFLCIRVVVLLAGAFLTWFVTEVDCKSLGSVLRLLGWGWAIEV